MKKEVGVWLDYEQAVIVTLFDQEEKIERINAINESSGLDSEEVKQDQSPYTHLSKYFDEIITHLQDADSLLILGPDEAKGELHRRVKGHGLAYNSVAIKPAYKMTDHQILIEVWQHFQESQPSLSKTT